jgi:hypothetical protein
MYQTSLRSVPQRCATIDLLQKLTAILKGVGFILRTASSPCSLDRVASSMWLLTMLASFLPVYPKASRPVKYVICLR